MEIPTPSFLIVSSSFLHVKWTGINELMSLNIGKTMELAAQGHNERRPGQVSNQGPLGP